MTAHIESAISKLESALEAINAQNQAAAVDLVKAASLDLVLAVGPGILTGPDPINETKKNDPPPDPDPGS